MAKMITVFILLSTFIFPTETALSLTVESDLVEQGAAVCGQNDILKCVVNPLPSGFVGWSTNLKPLTNCFPDADNSCSSASVDHYEFTSQIAEKTFNLTFNPVKFSDGSLEFRCTDGTTTESVTPVVKVLPQNSTTTVSETSSEMEVTTSCVFPVSSVTIEWYYYKAGVSPEKYVNSEAVQTEDTTGCTAGDCGGSGVQKITSRLTPDSEGEEYNFYVVVKHSAAPENDANYVVAKTFTRTFKVKAPAPAAPGTDGGCDARCKAGIFVGVVFLLFIIGCIVGCVKAALVEDDDNFKWILLSVIIIVGLGILTVMGIRRCSKKCKEDAGKKDNSAEKPKAKPGAHSVNPHSNQATTVTLKNEHKDHGSKVRPQPSPPGGAKGTSVMHGRPMPAIPSAHDSKGRSLSANFDDKEHPLVYIETPAQRKGALDTLDEGTGEESQKAKKKKKKSKNRDEE